MRGGGSRNDARKMHREKPAFNAGEQKKENRGIPRRTEQSNKPLEERKKENGKDHDDVRDCIPYKNKENSHAERWIY